MVVLLNDFNVELAAQNLCGLACQLNQHIHTHRHIGAAENRRFCAGGFQHGLILLGKTGGADDAGQTVLSTVLRGCDRPGGRGKINDYALAGQCVKPGVDRDFANLSGFTVHTRDNAAIVAHGDFFQQSTAHTAINALNDDIRHCYSSFRVKKQKPTRRLQWVGCEIISAGRIPALHSPTVPAQRQTALPAAGGSRQPASPNGSLPT